MAKLKIDQLISPETTGPLEDFQVPALF